ncbi:BapA/Bap/LapF family large adhesin [Pseudomonas sp. StFLB209]|uniref:BapA/Bap/LapF family large adhesin n=1 Tax=Pseudomonas sp. StFLB209 TaxID=1028989 RepID=UPI0005EE6A7B|nr:BapA/Bap/LapF family large adhesin [Pseudomonas sp. StFLB209]
MDNIVVADKASSTLSAQQWGNLQLPRPGVVQMPVAPGQVASVARNGQDLVLTLKSGEQITIGNFFATTAEGVGSDIVFQGEDGGLWQANYSAQNFNGFSFTELSSIDTLVASAGVVSGATQTFAIAGLGVLGAGGAAAAAGSSGSGDGGGSDGSTAPPASPDNLSLSDDGATLSGTGMSGATVSVWDANGNLLGSGQVGADGNFSVELDPPQTNGEPLLVDQVDPAGNSSGQAPVSAPDTTAPDAPGDLLLSSDGLTLSGTGEVGASVIIRAADGSVLGSAVVADDGTFSVALSSAQLPGTRLLAEQVDAAGNVSAQTAFEVSNPDALAAPANLSLSANGLTLSGTGQAGATVTVRDAAGAVLGSALVGTDGNFSVTLSSAQLNGETLSVGQVASDGQASSLAALTAADVTAPAAPGSLQLSADGLTLSGRGEAGATVSVRAANGTLLGTALVAADGTFSVPLSSAQLPGASLSVSQTDAAGNTSLPVPANPVDPTQPGAPGNLSLSADGQTLSGSALAGARITVRGANGAVLGSAVANPDGTFSVALSSAQLNGESLAVTQTDAQGRTSSAASLSASDVTAPDAPASLAFSADGSQLSGRAEPGSRVTVRSSNGTELGSAVVSPDGTFTIEFSTPVATGETLGISVSDRAGNTSASDPLIVPSPTDNTPPAAASNLVISSDGVQLSGRGEVGARVEVLDAQGNLIGRGVVGLDGQFNLRLSPAPDAGETLNVSLTDSAGNVSLNTPVSAPVATPQPEGLSNVEVASDGLTVTGRGSAGLRVFVRSAGRTLGSAVIASDGAFTVALDPGQTDGQALDVVAVDAAGNSTANEVILAPDTSVPDQVTDLVISPDGARLSGRGQAGANVSVTLNGAPLAGGVVAANGTFVITLSPPVTQGTELAVIQTEASGQSSVAAPVTAPDDSGPVAVQNPQINLQGTQVSGSGVAGTTIEVRDAQGNLLGSSAVANDGTYTVPLNTPQTNGQALSVVVIGANGSESIPAPLTAIDSTAPDQPGAVAINPNGLLLSGTGEPGAAVTVSDAQGLTLGTAQVGATGTFSVALSSAQTQGQILQVTLTDAAGNDSTALAVTAPSNLGNLQPSGLSLDSTGLVLSGNGQAGSTVTVNGPDGTVLGTALVAADGRFTVTLSAAQKNGQELSVVASNAGQTSQPVTLEAPDTQPPAAVTDLQLSSDRATVTGNGEPGATVTVRGANAVVLGSAPVNPDGSFSVTLAPVPDASQTLAVVQADPAGNVSPPLTTGAQDNTPPDALTNVVLSANGSQLSGNGEPGATVTVRNAQNAVVGSGEVAANGRFEFNLNTAQVNGQALTVVQTDAAGNPSPAFNITAPDIQPLPAPTDVSLGDDGLALSGNGTAGAQISVRDAAGLQVGQGIVAPDGRFSFELDSPQLNGERLQVVQVGPNLTSAPALLTAPDSTAPDPVDNLQVNSTGTRLTGTGEAGSTVRVTAADNSVLGTAVVATDGSFTVNLSPAQVNGQLLSVVQTDASGNAADALDTRAPDLSALGQPTGLAVDATGQVLTGNAPGGASVEVRSADGSLLDSAQVNPDGTFSANLGAPLLNGELLELVVIGNDGRSSPPLAYNVPDTLPLPAPTNLLISPDGLLVSGIAETGSTVTVSRNGTELGSAVAGADGVFVVQLNTAALSSDTLALVAAKGSEVSASAALAGPDPSTIAPPASLVLSADGSEVSGLATPGSTVRVSNDAGQNLGSSAVVGADGSFSVQLNPVQNNGQTLHVVAVDSGGAESVPGTLTAADTTAPGTPVQVLVSGDGSAVSGRAEAGARISVKDSNGVEIGFATVNSAGLFSVALDTPQRDDQRLSVTATDAAGNTSQAATVNAPDLLPPAAPLEVVINAAGTVVSGKGEPGSIVQVLDAQGALLAFSTVLPAGTFQVSLPQAQLSGAPLQVQLLDSANNASPAVNLATLDRTPPAPVSATGLSPDGSQLTGQGEAGATVQVRGPDGTLLGSGLVADNGLFSVILNPAPNNGQALAVVQVDAAGNTSPAVTVAAGDISAPDPLSNVVINRDGQTVTGNGEPGATVYVRAADGSVLGSALVAANGAFSVSLDTAQINAQTLTVNQEDPPGNEGPSVDITAPDLTAPLAPTALALNVSGIQLSGNAEAGSTVTVSNAAGQVVGSGVAAADGSFLLNLETPQLDGQALSVTARDGAGNVSTATLLTASDRTPPAQVTALSVSSDGTSLSGIGEVGARVEVRNASGTLLGSTTVNADSTFSVGLSPAATAGNVLSVAQADAAGNLSPTASVTAPGNLAPDVPANLLLGTDGLSLAGTGSVGSTVTVRGPGGNVLGTAVVNGDGSFSVTLSSAQLNGQTLSVSAQSNGLNSAAAVLTADDVTAPAALTDYRLAADGLTLTGRGEAGATVQVRAADGTLLGSALVNPDGTFSTQLGTAQTAGQPLSLIQTDAAGNPSLAVTLTAPDRVAPLAATDLAINDTGTVLSGKGEAGSTVTVTNAAGTVLGSDVVMADGSFQVLLSSAQLDGQLLAVSLRDAAGNVSLPSSLPATDTTAPLPLTELAIAGNGLTITGRGEANATVRVFDSQGNPLGSVEIGPTGSFSLTLSAPQIDSQQLTLTQTDLAGNVSPAGTLTAPDATPPAALATLQINSLGTLVTGNGEPGATVTVSSAGGTPLGSAQVLADGSFSVNLSSAQINLEVLSVRQTDAAGNVGPARPVTAPDLTPPAAPTNLQINASGDLLTGRGEANTEVRVNRADGTLAGSATVNPDGSFSVSLAAGSSDGSSLTVMLIDPAANMSPAVDLATVDRVAPSAVTNLQLDPLSGLLTGSGEVGASVQVRVDGTPVGTAQVQADGRFTVDLSALELEGQTFSVVQSDAAGNQSSAQTLVAPDLSVPAVPANLLLDTDGLVLTGTGLAGATVQVFSASASLLGSATVDPDGSFSVTLDTAQLNGEILTVRQTSPAGVVSADVPFEADDVTPAAPVSDLVLSTNGLMLTGKGQAGAEVQVRVGGVLLGSTTVNADGSFSVPLSDAQLNGEVLSVVQTDQSNIASDPSVLTAPDLIAPAQPTANPMVDPRLLTGTAEPGSTITVRAADGTLLGTAQTATGGDYSVTLNADQTSGAPLSVVASDAAGNASPALTIAGLDSTPPAPIDPATLTFNSALTVLSGVGEPGATVQVSLGGSPLGSALVAANGTFSVLLSGPVSAGDDLDLIQTDAAGNDSPVASIDVPAQPPTEAPTNLDLSADGTRLSGQGPVNATITVRALNGDSVGTAQVLSDGTFSVALGSAQTNGEVLSVSASLPPASPSIAVYLTADDSTAPAPLANLLLNSEGVLVTGTGEAGARVSITNSTGVELGSGVVSAGGVFSITLSSPQLNGQTLSAVQTDASGNASEAVALSARDITAPLAAGNLQVNAGGTIVSGTGEAGAQVRVSNAAGTELGTAVVTSNGTFNVTLSSAQLNGQALTVTLRDTALNVSLPASVAAPDSTAPLAPTNLAVNTAGLVLTGLGEAGARVYVSSPTGVALGNALVAANGSFTVQLSSAQLNFEALRVSQTDPAGNASGVATVNAPDITAPAIASGLSVAAGGASLSGFGEVGAAVTVRNAANQIVGSGVVGNNGQFSVSIAPAQIDGELLSVRLTDGRNNTSDVATVTAPDLTAPIAPATAVINASGTLMTGTGIIGDRIVVRDPAGTQVGSAVVGVNGAWSVVLNPPQINSQLLQVTQLDLAGNVSSALPVTAPDLTPPGAATGLTLATNGLTLSGSAEAGATITVKSAAGVTLGTATVQSNGNFSVPLNAAQINGEVLSISVTDRAGNLSPSVTLTAADIDVDRPVIANDNLATATVNLAAVATRTNATDSFPSVLGLGFSHTFNFNVASGTTAAPTLTLIDGGLLSLGTRAVFTLQVKDASGAWVTLGTAGSGALINLDVLASSGVRLQGPSLSAGEYRLTLQSNSLTVLTTINSNLQLDINSLTQFTGTAGAAVTGNVVTDPGPDGSVDTTGPDNGAVVRIQNGGAGYVNAGTGTVVQGLYGNLTIDAQGNYSYRANGTASSVGKVDVFNYQLVHPNGLSDPAVLYVRIDSPQATEVWSSTNLAAPALLLDATNDVASSSLSLGNLVTTETTTLGSASTLLGGINGAYTFSVANNTVSDLTVLLSSTNLLALLGNTTLEVYKLNTSTNQYALVKTVSGSSVLNLGGGQYGLTLDDQTPGSYRVNLRITGVGLLNTVTVSLVNSATATNQQVVTGSTPVVGNLLTDTAGGGADVLGSALTVLSVMTAANSFVQPGYNGTTLTGTYGNLLVRPDGSYTYTLKSGLTSSAIGNADQFTYKLTHPNGSSDTATLTINLNQAAGARMALASDDSDQASNALALAATAQVQTGTDGHDTLDGSQGGAVSLHGGAGDDTLVISDLNFAAVDGGSGTDTLLWAGGDASIDLGNVQGRLSNIDIIDLNGADRSSVHLTLDLADLVAVSDTSTLQIKGGEQDSVHMSGDWVMDGRLLADGLEFNQYTPQEDPTHHLWVQNGIQVV